MYKRQGTGGLSIGLALQGSLANFAGGVLILVSKPFIIGDYVQICGEEGIVKKIDIIYTTLVKYDNRIIKCPNGEVANNTIINYSNEDGRRVDVKFSVHYDSDLANVKNVVRDIISKCPYTLKDRSNDVAITKLDDSEMCIRDSRIIEKVVPYLPGDKPVYLMGVGTPANILEAVERGVDFFDCVYPSRNGRHGHVYTNAGKLNLFNAKYETDDRPIEEGCQCPACKYHTRAYIRHLLKAKEMLGMRLCVLHNLYFYNTMMEEIREAIKAGRCV